MINKQEIEHVAKLARLELKETEIKKITEEIHAILNYIDEIDSIDAGNTEVLKQIAGLSNIARTDEVTNTNDRENLLRNAPEQTAGAFKVKKVL